MTNLSAQNGLKCKMSIKKLIFLSQPKIPTFAIFFEGSPYQPYFLLTFESCQNTALEKVNLKNSNKALTLFSPKLRDSNSTSKLEIFAAVLKEGKREEGG